MIKRLILFFVGVFLTAGMALAQTHVGGVVVSLPDNEPVVGASVKVVGTTTGTVTDIDGKFSIFVPTNAKLEFSYIGMKSKVLAAKANMRVELETVDNTIDEVMVVAFGTQKKSAFTGSAAVVSSKDLSKRISTNVSSTLAGTVPGFQMREASGEPGASNGKMNIRGISSLQAKTDPLIIVDGAPYVGSLSNIPQQDIESVTVLKDAASAALYGARGASGVILITTKRGNTSEAVVTVDMKWGSNSRAIQDYDVIKDPGQYYETYYGMLRNKYYYNDGMSASDAHTKANTEMLSQLGYNVYTVPTGEQLIGEDGKLNPKATLGRTYKASNGETYYMTPDDWTKEAYRSSFRQDYNVSVSGGNTRSSFFASAGYLKDNGVILYSDYERYTARLKADYQAKKWLKVGGNIDYVHSSKNQNPKMDDQLNSSNLLYFTSMIAPIYPLYVRTLDANGNPVIRTDKNGNPHYDYGVPGNNFVDNAPRAFSSQGNPLGANRYNQKNFLVNQFNGTFNIDIVFTEWLKFNATSNLNFQHITRSEYDNSLYGPKVNVNGELTKYQYYYLRTNNVQTLDFHKAFGDHDVNVLAGHEYYNDQLRYLNGTATGGFSPKILELDAFATKSDNRSYAERYNVEGWFSRMLYSYKDKYYGSLSYRRDASSRFKKENRWGDFWSIGGAWNIEKESFFNIPWVNHLKLKLSLGQQGNDALGENWYYADQYRLSKSSDTTMSPSFRMPGNPDLTWETTTNLNVGVEFSLWKNLLSGSIDVYSKKISDMLFWLSLPEFSGTRGYYANVGDMRNSGLELSLTATPIRTRDITWSITAMLAHNTTKILKLPQQKTQDYGGYVDNGTGHECWYEVGKPLYNMLLPEYAGVNEHGQALYYVDTDVAVKDRSSFPNKKRNGTTTKISEASFYEQGSVLPKASGGFSTTVEAYGFDATFTFDYQLGGKVYDSRYASLMNPVESQPTGSNFHKDVLKSWTPNNTSSNIPRFQYGEDYSAKSSNRWLTNASYLNFQSFTVGYTLPRTLTGRYKISTLRVYVAGENLYFWSARKGFDPRYSFDGNKSVGVYSPTRNITGGLQVTF
ncbi:SusC/RagA family TonB-linked outer membrane protein [Hoylesella loescheii]|uniref:SusC/RagA family TonB-linked outer membrane protein n=1 Tax=Hoylesella loescheii TaxID=840 RepID=UPI0028E82B59|nr:SusC/RagA family TonB-linked outer membrane protein [Hoylesella loescheii]